MWAGHLLDYGGLLALSSFEGSPLFRPGVNPLIPPWRTNQKTVILLALSASEGSQPVP